MIGQRPVATHVEGPSGTWVLRGRVDTPLDGAERPPNAPHYSADDDGIGRKLDKGGR
jgi:hypothetical protein